MPLLERTSRIPSHEYNITKSLKPRKYFYIFLKPEPSNHQKTNRSTEIDSSIRGKTGYSIFN